MKDKPGINRPIICKKCGHKIGYVKLKPELLELMKKGKRKETWFYIFLIALATQFISDVIITIFKSIWG